jgi:predicted methyltransferase
MIKILSALLLVSNVCIAQTDGSSSNLAQAIASEHRSAEHKARDLYRHPEQTLTFFDVQDTMTVVEVWPGEGWYTEILAPYLKEKGKIYTAHYSVKTNEPYFKKSLDKFVKKMQQKPELFGKVEITEFEPPNVLQIAPDNSVDRVLSFRNTHNWMSIDQAATVYVAMYKALKPGGILGVVEHRYNQFKPQNKITAAGYVREDDVIALARNAGFEFLQKSEINANRKDKKNYPKGVWTLPPTWGLKDQDREIYEAIGESDRMTIKFIKPK